MTKSDIEQETIKFERIFLDEKKISRHLICKICKKVFNNPVVLDCTHTFCYYCIKKEIKEKKRECPICHEKILTNDFSRDLMAYNLVMELEVLCNNVGKCPWIGHLSELVAHQNICNKTIKILQENKQKLVQKTLKRFSFEKAYNQEQNDNGTFIFSKSERKNNNISKDTKIMLTNLEEEKRKVYGSQSFKNSEFKNEEEEHEFKLLFS